MADNDTPLIKLIGNEPNDSSIPLQLSLNPPKQKFNIDDLFKCPTNFKSNEKLFESERGSFAIVLIIFLIGVALYLTIDCERSKKGKVYYDSGDDSLTVHIEDGKGVHSINKNSLLTTYDKDEKVIIMELMGAHKVFGIPLETLKKMENKK